MIENADTVSELAVPSKGKDEDSASNILSAAGLEESSVALADSYRSPGTTEDDKGDNLCDPDNEALVICDSKNGSPALQHPVDSSQASQEFEGKPSESRITMDEPAGSLDIDAGVPENSLYALQSLTASMPSYQDCTYLAGQESSCASLQAFAAPQAGDAVSSRSHAAMEEVSPTSKNNASDNDRSQDSSGYHFKCETCCKSFMYFNFLTRHRRMHKAKTPFEYQTSSGEIGKPEQLILHQHTHTGDRPGNRSPGSTKDDRSHNECDPDNEALTICDMNKEGSPGFQHPVDSSQAFEAKRSESCTTKDEPASTLGNDAGVPEDASYALQIPTACIPSYHECTAQEEQNSSCMSLPVLTTLLAGDAVSSTSDAVMEELSPTFVNNAMSPGSTGDDRNDNLCDPDNEAPVIFDGKNRSPALQHRVDSSQAFDAKPSGSRMTMDEAVGDLGNDAGSPGSTEDDRSHVSDLDNEAPTICDMNKERSPGLQHPVDSSQAFEGKPSRSCMIMDEPAGTQDNDAGVPENSSYALQSPTACTPSCHECTAQEEQNSSCMSLPVLTTLLAGDAVSSTSDAVMEELSPTFVNNAISPGSTEDDRCHNKCDPDNEALTICDVSKKRCPGFQHPVDSSQAFEAKHSESCTTKDEPASTLGNDAGVPENFSYALQSPTACIPSYHECRAQEGPNSSCMSLPVLTTLRVGDSVSSTSHAVMEEVSPTFVNNATSPGSTGDDRNDKLCDPDNVAPVICDSKNGSPALQHRVDSSQAFDAKPSGSRMTMDEAVGALGNDAGSPGSTEDDRSHVSDLDNEAPTICDMNKEGSPGLQPPVDSSQAFEGKPSGSSMIMDEPAGTQDNDAGVPENSSYALQSPTACMSSYHECTELAGQDSRCTSLPAFTTPQAGDAVSSTTRAAMEEGSPTSVNNATYAIGHRKTNQLDDSVLGIDNDSSQDSSQDRYKCKTCGESFRYFNFLAKHRTLHTTETPYGCKTSSEELRESEQLILHQHTHTGDGPCNYAVSDKSFKQIVHLVTPQCTDDEKKCYNLRKRQKLFSMVEKLAVHGSVHAEEKRYNCKACGKSFGRARLLVIHQRSHTDRPCNYAVCDKSFEQVAQLVTPQCTDDGKKRYNLRKREKSFGMMEKVAVHQSAHAEEKRYNCRACGESFGQSRLLVIHQRMHTGVRPYKCETCQQSFARSDQLSRHRLTHTGEKPYDCKTCGKSFVRSDKLFLHQRTHTGLKPYKCETCQQSFARSDKLSRHRLTHTAEKRYNCKTCGKSFVRSDKLFLHQRTHTGLKPYKCETCQQSFARSDKLSRHQLTHTGEKRYNCKTCGKSFVRSDKLFLHQRTHTGLEPYKCKTCQQCFVTSDKLSRHRLTHTGKKPHVCKICEKSFARSDKLFFHQRMHMDENLHTCTTCGKSFAQRASLVRHKCTYTGKTPHILKHAASHSLN